VRVLQVRNGKLDTKDDCIAILVKSYHSLVDDSWVIPLSSTGYVSGDEYERAHGDIPMALYLSCRNKVFLTDEIGRSEIHSHLLA
jgi:hypothetical protein